MATLVARFMENPYQDVGQVVGEGGGQGEDTQGEDAYWVYQQ